MRVVLEARFPVSPTLDAPPAEVETTVRPRVAGRPLPWFWRWAWLMAARTTLVRDPFSAEQTRD